jgi:branched-chain amino acid aminotransferase
MAVIHLNGTLVETSSARIHPADRGLLLADGLFETLRVYDGRPFRLDQHLHRLAAGAALLDIPIPPANPLATAIAETLSANDHHDASVRVTLTRGPGPRGLLPPGEVSPTLLITSHPMADTNPQPLSACFVAARRNEHSPLSQLKTLAYLDNVLALRDAVEAGYDEALLMNTAGRLASGSRSNLFLVIEGVLMTPPASEGVLPGIARSTLLELAAQTGIASREAPLDPSDLNRASEVFVSNSLLELRHLTCVDDREFQPGPVGIELARLYAEMARRA